MDSLGLTVLLRELDADAAVVREAARQAAARLREQGPGHAEACAYELARLYNTLEKMFERICEEFENHFEKRGDYHERLVQRLTLDLPGIRPAFIPAGSASAVRELKGFRHVVRHAYDLKLKTERLAELAVLAEGVAANLSGWCEVFGHRIRAEQGWYA
jgi:hypothetical protein